MVLGLTQPLTKMSTRNISWGWRRPACRADNPTTFMCQVSWNLGASTSWNPQGPSRPVKGFLYPLPFVCTLWATHGQPRMRFSCHCRSSVPSRTRCCMHALSAHKLQVTDREYLAV